MMTAQDMVCECFPEAVVREIAPIVVPAVDVMVDSGYWAVFAGPRFEDEELGWGRTETEAWSDAAGLQGNQAA